MNGYSNAIEVADMVEKLDDSAIGRSVVFHVRRAAEGSAGSCEELVRLNRIAQGDSRRDRDWALGTLRWIASLGDACSASFRSLANDLVDVVNR